MNPLRFHLFKTESFKVSTFERFIFLYIYAFVFLYFCISVYLYICTSIYEINNVFKEKELEEKSNVQFLHIANSSSAVKDSLTAEDGRISIKINIF